MKNFYLLVLLMTAVAFTGCKKDDEDKQKQNIVGKWYVKQTIEKEIVNGVVISEETETDFDTDYYFEFTKEGKMIENISGDKYTGSYQVKGNNRVAITFQDEEPDDYEIRKLNSTEMILYIEDEDGPNSKETIEITFRK
ncbi:lipocalin family protein [Pedobacter nyackensis]|uniref:lipocalin family protein n=1 Tax=Pedobacter nyackensis TaxID=475255 RepID=UPI00292F3E62|nr:lipocalin family protein [Pedobacter nyackensis]